MQKYKVKKTPALSTFSKILYGSGDLAYGTVITTVNSFLMFFGNSVCGIPATLMGLCMAICTCWDAVTDPVVGYLSDRHYSRFWGRRHGYLACSFVGMAVFNLLFWSVPLGIPTVLKFFWLLGCLLMIDTFGTFYATPNTALGVEVTNDYGERTAIQSVKSTFFLIGSLLPTILMAILQSGTLEYPDGRYDPSTYLNMAFIGSALCILTGFFCMIGSYAHVPKLNAVTKRDDKTKSSFSKIFTGFFSVLKIPIFRTIILGYTVTMMSSAFLTSAGLYVLTFSFKLQAVEMYVLMAMLFLMTIFSQPLWIYLVNRFDKRIAILTGMFMTILGMIYMAIIFVVRESISLNIMVFAVAPALVLAGGGMGALYSLPNSMMGDAAAIEKAKTNEEKTGTYTGFMTFSNKLGQAMASLLVGVLIDVIGFKEGATTQTVPVQWGLGWIVILGCLIPLIGGMIIYSRYHIKKTDIPTDDVVPLKSKQTTNSKSIIVSDEDNKDWSGLK